MTDRPERPGRPVEPVAGECGPADPSRSAEVAASAALLLGSAHAAVTVSWAVGGTAGLDLLGGTLADLVRDAGPRERLLLWLTAAAKLGAATPGVLLVAGPRRLRRVAKHAAYAVGALLSLYGGVRTLAQGLVVAGAIEASADADRRAILGHLFLWDPWFLLWGCALLVAARMQSRRR